MKTFCADMPLPIHLIDQINLLCTGPAAGCGRDEVVFDREATFPDGRRMVVQAVAPNEPDEEGAWTQGVLFDSAGIELGFTEPGDRLDGEYSVACDGAVYSVRVSTPSVLRSTPRP